MPPGTDALEHRKGCSAAISSCVEQNIGMCIIERGDTQPFHLSTREAAERMVRDQFNLRGDGEIEV